MRRYLQLLLRHQGLTVLDYYDEALSVDDIFLCDDPQQPEWTARTTICFFNEYIGPAEEISPGYWHVSPAFTGDLPLLLNYLYRSERTVCPVLPALQVMLLASVNNDDILILMVDDHPINRRLRADQLGSLSYQVITANDGLDALNVISRQAVDIILSDVNMPNMDGYQFARALRTQGRVTPVVGVTANALAEENSTVWMREWTTAYQNRCRWRCCSRCLRPTAKRYARCENRLRIEGESCRGQYKTRRARSGRERSAPRHARRLPLL